MEGITDAMRQYEKTIEAMLNNKQKHSRPYGIKRLDSMNIIAALAGLFIIIVIISEVM